MSDPKQDPPITSRDRACAVFARAALFPMKVDWSGKHHVIYPALQALDLTRKDALDKKNTPYSSLFPRRVMLVPLSNGEMQWSGQPDIVDSSVEVIPNMLSVKCIECSEEVALKGSNSFIRTKEQKVSGEKSRCHEIVLCTNRLLKNDYNKSSDPTLLEQRRDLPPSSLASVEEALAHQMTKVRGLIMGGNDKAQSPCEQYAALEVQAAKAAECMYQKQGKEIRKGSCLRPVGFSLLPRLLQQNLQNRCLRAVAAETTGREFGMAEGKKCVDSVMEQS